MKKTVLTYGLISGVVAVVLMLVTVLVVDSHDRKGEIAGYTGIVLAGLVIFFGVRSYRENVGDGRITFGRGFTVGILIALISCACYVLIWEVVYFKVAPGIGDKIFASQIEQVRASGASQEKIDEVTLQMESFKKMYANPLVNAALTLLEPFPVHLMITLISAAVLRRK